MNIKHIFKVSLAALFFVGITSSCSDDDDNADSQMSSGLQISLTDAPGDYDSVFVEVQSIEVTTDQGKSTFPLLQPGIYNLLDYSNGFDTVLVDSRITASRINQIRLILGTNNRVVKDGQSHPLQTPSAQQSGLKLNVQYDIVQGAEYRFILDFDASRSIVEQGNGGFLLKPVIRVITEAVSGGIEGRVVPDSAAYYTYVVANGDTIGTAVDSTGYFKIIAVPAGSYTLNANATAGYTDQTLSGVNVINGQITDVDTIQF